LVYLNKSKIEDDENIDVLELLFCVFIDVVVIVVDDVLFVVVVVTTLLLFVRLLKRAAFIDIADKAAAAILAEACAFVVTNALGVLLLDIVCEFETVVVGFDVVAVTVIN
jgi:hypothetical protein